MENKVTCSMSLGESVVENSFSCSPLPIFLCQMAFFAVFQKVPKYVS